MNLKLLDQIRYEDISFDDMKITGKAIEQAVAAHEDKDQPYLRIGVKGGGCSGFLYVMEFTNEIDNEDDRVYSISPDLNIVVDIFSLEYLKGVTIDYISSLKESGFKFINPNVIKTCGCGSSFSA